MTIDFPKIDTRSDVQRDAESRVADAAMSAHVSNLRAIWRSPERAKGLLPALWSWTKKSMDTSLSVPLTTRRTYHAADTDRWNRIVVQWDRFHWHEELIPDRARTPQPSLWYAGAVDVFPARRQSPGFEGLAGMDFLRAGGRLPNVRIEHFKLQRELIGRVREINGDAGEFTAVLNERGADAENEVVGRFPLALLSDADRARLDNGTAFNLVTGYRRVMTTSGEVVKSGIETRVVLRRPSPLSAARVEEAIDEARRLRAS
jgi:hypothetical protein